MVVKILATNFGVFFVIHSKYYVFKIMFDIRGFNNYVIKYYGSTIPHDRDMIFEKFGGLSTVVGFSRKLTSKAGAN